MQIDKKTSKFLLSSFPIFLGFNYKNLKNVKKRANFLEKSLDIKFIIYYNSTPQTEERLREKENNENT